MSASFSFIQADPALAPQAAALAEALWPGHAPGELTEEFIALCAQKDAAVFLAYADDLPCGFAQCGLRQDYVEGTSSSPVGYLEGVYVLPEQRNRGIARLLVAQCEDWARKKGCSEFASDCELTNTQSLAFHLHTGFTEANRIICFTKTL